MYTGEDYFGEIRPIVGCQRCELAFTRNNIAIYRGDPGKAEVMIIGEAPGEVEDKTGIPMTGPTGSYLVRIMKDRGFGLDRLYITNIVLCIPPGVGEKRIREPTNNESRMCRKWLDLQISLIKPKVILAVGRPAVFSLIPSLDNGLSINKLEGRQFVPEYLCGTIVIPIRHPSGIRRRGSEDDYEASMTRICRDIEKIIDSRTMF